jgi:hypothetical protein
MIVGSLDKTSKTLIMTPFTTPSWEHLNSVSIEAKQVLSMRAFLPTSLYQESTPNLYSNAELSNIHFPRVCEIGGHGIFRTSTQCLWTFSLTANHIPWRI